ncbi:hypothetical protein COS31_02730 [Candidatus Roizmanbacteria bacterium CG02_land_8_20_14_3_00_36_15]|uniref:Uncharacterized protein n=2 Tax=Candidatus Roizmaniibacteriota TaxID=1752723 RepID=A0A2M8KKT8_9BACT|nr:MAG: hypothetical protein COS51_05380 [Candidatus Roizmanbacteria bacterium CG03_land_8_20_14_0_80_36_21]PIV37820.1 MAG: hypothetical protein COS31_02730 [Candidatus Roizmanbacteria bacterium CG02_land_8_20_14_3_00_36_15]PJC81250.1 MAG: hypothetical protein CO007_05635 [Candidatus Roizmanbacteria bacterium CG_4_8_14_3_um_filter_36_10]PJE60537.1 MAG: hypothetical protein COU86_03680 [Candidatus Roizmanbacteria bacterium CG10_big_fil_rev_8_21_14_0_10_36_26]
MSPFPPLSGVLPWEILSPLSGGTQGLKDNVIITNFLEKLLPTALRNLVWEDASSLSSKNASHFLQQFLKAF